MRSGEVSGQDRGGDRGRVELSCGRSAQHDEVGASRVPVDEIEVDHLNRTVDRRPYWPYYDHGARDAVEAVCGPTLDRFGYRF